MESSSGAYRPILRVVCQLVLKYNFNGAIMRISDSESDNICVPALPESRSTVSISSQVAGQQPTSEQDQQQQQQQQTKS